MTISILVKRHQVAAGDSLEGAAGAIETTEKDKPGLDRSNLQSAGYEQL
jgi:hypothetical protein